jgi:hypothetical protein
MVRVKPMGRHWMERKRKKRFKYVTHGIAGKYPEHFAKESNEISYPASFLFALQESQRFQAVVLHVFLFDSDFSCSAVNLLEKSKPNRGYMYIHRTIQLHE